MNKTKKILILLTIGLLIIPIAMVKAQEVAPPPEPEIDMVAPPDVQADPDQPINPETPEGARDIIMPTEPVAPVQEPVIAPVPIAPSPTGEIVTPEGTIGIEETAPADEEQVVEEPGAEEPESVEQTLIEEVVQDEKVLAEDLDTTDPRLLPTNPYYPIKNIWRGVRSAFTFNPLKKAELKLQFANERLIEAKKVAEDLDNPKVVAKALEKYQKDISDVSKIIEKAPEIIKEEAEKFAEKMIDHSFKQQRLIDGIERRLEPEHFERVNAARKGGIENFAQTVTHIIPAEKIQEKINNVIKRQAGSDFKDFKNIEVLKAIEEKVPEAAREAIHQAQENTIKRLQETMAKITDEKRERFEQYVEDTGGNEVRHLEIIHDFTAREIPEIIRQEMEKAKEKAIMRIDKKMKEFKVEEQKRQFLQHLEDGKIEDLRIIKELENNLAPETIDKVLEIKNKSLDNFRHEFEQAETEEQQEKFFQEMEQFNDVKQFEVFKEIEKIIPEDKKEFFEGMKEKAMEEMKKEFERGREQGRRQAVLRKIAGDMPEHFEIIQEFAPPPEIMNEILKEQAERLSHKIETIEDAEKLQAFERRIEEEEMIRKELEKRTPEIFRNIERKSELILEEIKTDEVIQKLETAKNELKHTKEYLDSLENKPEIMEHLKHTPVLVHLENAKKHVDEAVEALGNEKYGHAFGEANAALHELRNISRIIKDSELRTEITHKRVEEMGKMMEEMEYMEEVEETLIRPMPVEPGEPVEEMMMDKEEEIMRKMMEKKIDLQFDTERFSEEEIQKMEQIKRNLPLDIRYKLQNIPMDMMLEAMEKLQVKVQDRQGPQPTDVEPMPMPEPGQMLQKQECRPVCKGIGTRSEGWYNSCTNELIEWAKCSDRTTSGSTVEQPSEPVGMPNPASEYCIKKGGKLEIKTNETGGQFGVCYLPDGIKCEEWAFFKGECPKVSEKKQETTTDVSRECPKWAPPAPDWCRGGKIVYEPHDEQGCPRPPKCIRPTDTEPIEQPMPYKPTPLPKPSIFPEEETVVCIQVVTPAKNPKTGECKYFPTPCDVPEQWEKVESCKDIVPIRQEELREEKYMQEEQIKIEQGFIEKEKERLLELEKQTPVYEKPKLEPIRIEPVEPKQIYEKPLYEEPIPVPEEPVYDEPVPTPTYEEPKPVPEEPVYDEPVPTPTSGGGGGGTGTFEKSPMMPPGSAGGLSIFDKIKRLFIGE